MARAVTLNAVLMQLMGDSGVWESTQRVAGETINSAKFHRFTVHFDSLSFFTSTHALSHTTMY
jgi:hypothetical protein